MAGGLAVWPGRALGPAHRSRAREQTAADMAVSSEHDRARDSHLEAQARAANQTDPGNAARLDRYHMRLGETATAALGAQVGGQRLGRATLLRVTRAIPVSGVALGSNRGWTAGGSTRSSTHGRRYGRVCARWMATRLRCRHARLQVSGFVLHACVPAHEIARSGAIGASVPQRMTVRVGFQ